LSLFIQTFSENKALFIAFLLSSLAGFMAAYLPFVFIPILALVNDFVLVSLLGGLKENIKDGKKITPLEMLGYGKRFFPRALLAHLIVLACGFLVTAVLVQIAFSLDLWVTLAFVVFSLAGFFLAFVFSSMLYYDAAALEAVWFGLSAFFKLKPGSFIMLIIISLLSYVSISLHSRLLDILSLLMVSACFWYAYLNSFIYFKQKAADT
jgi:hypothetical protein